jgi:serine/threonine protein kinase
MPDRSPDLHRAGDTLATTGDPQVAPDGAGGAGILAAGPGPAARYRLGEEIARGGMGVVCRATDTVLGREVAVKVLQAKYAADSGTALRFVAEARITGQLQHPGIPAIHDLGILPDGRPFLAMKLIKGETLDQLLRRRDAAAA